MLLVRHARHAYCYAYGSLIYSLSHVDELPLVLLNGTLVVFSGLNLCLCYLLKMYSVFCILYSVFCILYPVSCILHSSTIRCGRTATRKRGLLQLAAYDKHVNQKHEESDIPFGCVRQLYDEFAHARLS